MGFTMVYYRLHTILLKFMNGSGRGGVDYIYVANNNVFYFAHDPPICGSTKTMFQMSLNYNAGFLKIFKNMDNF